MVSLISSLLALFFIIERGLKLATVIHFFRRPAPPLPERWPTISLIQPITQGATNLELNLLSRLTLDYPAEIQHIWVCDQEDGASQAICATLQQGKPTAAIQMVQAAPDGPRLASKVAKLQAGLGYATGDIFCFVDDDIGLKPDALGQLIPYLQQPQAGAVFGLACAVSWNTLWSSLMSIFVNSHALLSYIPLTYCADPFTITGHVFAISRHNFEAAGGLSGMARRIDDDHELARRLQAIGLKSIQTPLIYHVSNELASYQEYAGQVKRWFVFPRQAMTPHLALYQKALTYGLSLGLWLPTVAGLLALFSPSATTLLSLLLIAAIYVGVYLFCAAVYLKHSTPLSRLPLALIVATLMPLHILWALLVPDTTIMWRGQQLRIERGGSFQASP